MHKIEISRDEFKLIASTAGADALHDLLGKPQVNADFVTTMYLYTRVISKVLARLENSLFGDDSKED